MNILQPYAEVWEQKYGTNANELYVNMQKQIEFTIPDGYIRDEENTTDKKVVYKLKEDPPIAKSWEEVCKVMFPMGGNLSYVKDDGQVGTIYITSCSHNERNNVTSKAQGEKLMAINQLMIVAKYLNGLYPDIPDMGAELYIDTHGYPAIYKYSYCFVTFRSEELAKKAIEILGEDVIKLALTVNNY